MWKFLLFYFRCLIFGHFLSHFQISDTLPTKSKFTPSKHEILDETKAVKMIVLLQPQGFTNMPTRKHNFYQAFRYVKQCLDQLEFAPA